MRTLALGCLLGSLLCSAGCGGDSDADGSGGTSGSGGAAGAGGSGAAPGEIAGCSPDVLLLEKSSDFSLRGPWPVGVRTVKVGTLTAEVWYPAELGSEQGKSAKVYDIRSWLPDSEKAKIPDSENPWQASTSFADLPLDSQHGPYPPVVFVHGTAGFRTQSLSHMEHWASRGFVVIAADHPGLYLGDMLDFALTKDIPGNLDALLAALAGTSGDLAFLKGHVDAARVGMAGHSAGGGAITSRGNDAQVLIPLAAGGSAPGSKLVSTLVMGGLADKVVPYTKTADGYAASPSKKRLLGLSKAGHLFPSSLCWLKSATGLSILEVAQKYQIKNANLAGALFDCPADSLSEADSRAVVDWSTAAVLEETLHCRGGDAFSEIQTRYPAVGEYQQAL